MKSSQLFSEQFKANTLRKIFEDNILDSGARGKDGISPQLFQTNISSEISLILSKVNEKSYKFTNFKQKLILKGAGKPPREISIATVRDRIVLRAVTNILMGVFYDIKLNAPHHFIQELSTLIKPLGDDYSFIQMDIKDFYPSIDHDELRKRIRSRVHMDKLLKLILCAIRTPTGNARKGAISGIGVPQGLSISNILSAIYMKNFDNKMRDGLPYFRYVDDIIIICPSPSASKIHKTAENQLKNIGLTSHPLASGSKTKIVPVSKGIDYLGYHLKPGSISVRQSSIKRMMDRIMAVMTSAKTSKNGKKILAKLNLRITGCVFNYSRMGWMFFFSMTTELRQIKRLDEFVAKNWKSLGLEKFGKPKRFIKTYYEIRYNLLDTKYIPKFDDYTIAQKADLISELSDNKISSVLTWSEEQIEQLFMKILRKEISDLELDMTPLS